jgi:hypothetical protein
MPRWKTGEVFMAEHAVIVRFDYGSNSLDALYELEDRLSGAIADAGEGECDGHDVTPDLSKATIYLYGPDAEILFVVAQQVLEYSDCVHNAVALLRFGPPEDGVIEREVRLVRRC